MPAAAEHRLPPGRRPRLRRRRLLRPAEDPHAEHRSPGGRRHALHAALQRQRRVRSLALRADDRQASRPRLHPRQPRHAAGRAVSDSAGDRHAGGIAPAAGLHVRRLRQMGTGRARQRGRAAQAGLRSLLRLQLPGRGAQLLSHLPLGQRSQAAAGQSAVRVQSEAAGRRRSARPGQLRALSRPRVRAPT